MDGARVLVVEDEGPIRDGLLALFEGQGLIPHGVADGAQALEALASEQWDLVILDLMIPEVEGLDVLRQTRARGSDVPVLILTAKGSEDDVVAGLESGADDYVTKPFGIRELVARAKGLLRRRPVDTTATCITLCLDDDEVTVNFDTLEVHRKEATVRLTSREGSLLAHLVGRRHRPVTREELLVDVWGYRDGSIRTRTVDVHVQQLRAKLATIDAASWIATVRGRGYRFSGELVDGAE